MHFQKYIRPKQALLIFRTSILPTYADYVGCFNGTGVPMAITSYDSMTITLCVEVCRTLNKSFAFLGSTSCGCDSDYYIYSREYGQCKEPCSGQTMSVCGGKDNDMSVYDTGNVFILHSLV